MRLRPRNVLLPSLALAVLIGGAIVYVEADKSVLLSVDGETRTVRTFSGDVAGLLEDQGIEVEPMDTVSPDVETGLRDGQKIAVRNGRLMSVTVDGDQEEFWTTAQTVDEALDGLGYRADRIYLSTSRSKRIPLDGLALEVRRPKDVTIVADGTSRTVTTTAANVGRALAHARLALSATDEVSAPLTSALTDGMSLTVVRVTSREELVERAVPYAAEERADDTLLTGTRRVVQAGTNGTVVDVYSIQYRDGVESGRWLVQTRPGTAAVNEVVAVGTRPRSQPAAPAASTGSTSSEPAEDEAEAPSPTSDGLDWGALAQCESGGNPRAVSPNGRWFGLYQFDLGTWRAVGGSGNPVDASPSEQTARAQALYEQRGRSPWPYCGRFL